MKLALSDAHEQGPAVDIVLGSLLQGSGSASLISLGDSSAPEDSDFVASDSDEEDDEADSPERMRRPYQSHVKNRALQADVEIIEEECKEPQYNPQTGEVLCGCMRHSSDQSILHLVNTPQAGGHCAETKL